MVLTHVCFFSGAANFIPQTVIFPLQAALYCLLAFSDMVALLGEEQVEGMSETT